LASIIMPVFSFLVPAKYKPVKGMDVAQAMAAAAIENQEGAKIYHFKEIIALSRKL